MAGDMVLRIWDVQHGACAMLHHRLNGVAGRLAMIDSGCTADWHPSTFIRYQLGRTTLDYLIITNADQDHLSDLAGLETHGIAVTTLHRNWHPPAQTLRTIKLQGGPLTNDMERYLALHAGYIFQDPQPFDSHMGGISLRTFSNTYPTFKTTNDLSLVAFIQYGNFRIVFPGDLERAGWVALLEVPEFRAQLAGTTVFVASHHGRKNGYCEEVFDHCHPRAVIMSDKRIEHETQQFTPIYRQRVIDHHADGVLVATTKKQRHVLTTRRDGTIQFRVTERGDFMIETEKQG